jgi:hypothetical protein
MAPEKSEFKTYEKDVRVRVTVKPYFAPGEHGLYEVVNVLVLDEIPDEWDLFTKEELYSLGIEVDDYDHDESV